MIYATEHRGTGEKRIENNLAEQNMKRLFVDRLSCMIKQAAAGASTACKTI
ncbi:MAG: hypothetical protein IKN54_02365 [Lachnospiraceae bacterium]|nr:hypothetical protein [Lachnospiraceae bacterium]